MLPLIESKLAMLDTLHRWTGQWVSNLTIMLNFCRDCYLYSKKDGKPIILVTTYIHNWSLHLFSQDCKLASHTTYVVCINFIHKWRDLQFKVDSVDRFFEKPFMAILFTLRVFTRSLLRGNRQRNIFCIFVFMTGLGLEPWLFV